MAAIIGMLCLLAVLASGEQAADRPRPELDRIAARLELTSRGAGRWLESLGVRPQARYERLLVTTTSGNVVATRDGDETHVLFGDELESRLNGNAEELVLIHNHPGGSALSITDLFHLSHPGVIAVAAIGHDGSVYVAVRGARYNARRFMEEQYEPVRAALGQLLRIKCDAGMISRAAAARHVDHLAALALARAGVIDYRAEMSKGARESYGLARIGFDGVVGAASALLAVRH